VLLGNVGKRLRAAGVVSLATVWGCGSSNGSVTAPGGGGAGAGGSVHQGGRAGSTTGAGGHDQSEGGSAGTDSGGAGTGGGGAGTGGAGGAGGGGGGSFSADASIRCPQGYGEWFSSSFSFPEGGILGTADHPSAPWVVTLGAVTTVSGAATATVPSIALANYGTHFPLRPFSNQYNERFSFGTRVRYRLTFTDNTSGIEVRLNANQNGDGAGFRYAVSPSGILFGGSGGIYPIKVQPSDGIYFVEIELVDNKDAPQFRATTSSGNYASKPGATLLAETLFQDTGVSAGADDYVAFNFQGHGGSVDDVLLSRCQKGPQDYTALFADKFERAELGSPDAPDINAAIPWQAPQSGASLKDGALVTENAVVSLTPKYFFIHENMRARTAVTFGDSGTLVLSYNDVPDPVGSLIDGFEITRAADGTSVYFYADKSTQQVPAVLTPGQKYFIESNVQYGASVVTLRSESYAGPIVFSLFANALDGSSSMGLGGLLQVGSKDNAGAPLAVHELFFDQYWPQSAF